MAYTTPQLLSLSQKQLDDLFSSSPSGDIPNGEAQGTAIIAPGTTFSQEIASLINIFAWQGKTFDARQLVVDRCRESRSWRCCSAPGISQLEIGKP